MSSSWKFSGPHSHHKKETPSKGGSKPTKPSRSSANSSSPPELSFLFVVIRLNPDLEPFMNQTSVAIDQWGNPLPPMSPERYGDETPGVVFRYADGVVSQATGYYWARVPGQEGRISRLNQDESVNFPATYSTRTVFACSPMLPLVVTGTDPSVYHTYVRMGGNSNSSFQPVNDQDYGADKVWSLLHFAHSPEESVRGISQACLGGMGRPYVVGTDPSWIPSLVPEQFRNTRQDESIPESRGLSGELPLVIALMALWDHSDRAPGDAFRRGRWHHRRWTSSEAARGYPSPEDDPRGFLVQVCLDDLENPDTSTKERLWNFEWYGVMVRD